MATIQIAQDNVIPLNEVLAGIAGLNTADLERFQQEINLMLAQRRSTSLKEQESTLLLRINNRVVPSVWHRYQILHSKMQGETITSEEQQELLKLIEQIESSNVEWLKNIVELSRLRGITPENLMKQLDINLSYAHSPKKNS